jgi:hypothetical protein
MEKGCEMSKVTWNDIKDATSHELKKVYKLNDRQLEVAVRKHLDGANQVERRAKYQELYGKRK